MFAANVKLCNQHTRQNLCSNTDMGTAMEEEGMGREGKGRGTVRTCCWAALKISEPQWAKLLSVSMLKSLSGFACSSLTLRCSFARESQPVKRQGLNGHGKGNETERK